MVRGPSPNGLEANTPISILYTTFGIFWQSILCRGGLHYHTNENRLGPQGVNLEGNEC